MGDPFRPKPVTFVRDYDGRIVAVRPRDDPWFALDFLRDLNVQRFFADLDERAGRQRVPELDPLAADPARARSRPGSRRDP